MKHTSDGGVDPRTLSKILDNEQRYRQFIKPLVKWQRILHLLAIASIRNCPVTRFDAELVGDHCLHSTISDIQKYHGIRVERNYTKRPGQFGEIRCCEYWLKPSEIIKVQIYFSSLP